MTPTLQPGERILVRRTILEKLRRGQIVVLANPAPFPGDPPWLVKRLAALPGDPTPPDAVPASQREAVVPPGKLVVLGDNATASHDSRTAGYFDASTLLGVAVRQRLTV
jgi:signal peptidase I